MVKKYYIIEAKGKDQILENKMIIENCVYIEKNHKVLDKNGKFKKIDSKNITVSDRISMGITAVVVLCILVMLICFALQRDYCGIENVHIDNIISEIGLIFAVLSIKPIRIMWERSAWGPRILKKLLLCIIIMLAPFYIAAFFSWLNISRTICNCLSVSAIIISVILF